MADEPTTLEVELTAREVNQIRLAQQEEKEARQAAEFSAMTAQAARNRADDVIVSALERVGWDREAHDGQLSIDLVEVGDGVTLRAASNETTDE